MKHDLNEEPTVDPDDSETFSYFECTDCLGITEVACPRPGLKICCDHCGASFILT